MGHSADRLFEADARREIEGLIDLATPGGPIARPAID